MQTIAIKTAQNIDIDYEVAGLGERILARLIDYVLYLAVYLIYIWTSGSSYHPSVFYSFTLPQILFFLFYGFYDIITELLFNGQSLGKYIMKIKVISLDGGRPRLGQYLLRYIFRLVDFGLTLQIGAIISVAVTENKQRIGDIVANTTLVKTKTRTGIDMLNFVHIEEDYQPVIPEAVLLADTDISLIHEVLNHFNKTGEVIFVDRMAERVCKQLDITITPGLTSYKFLVAVLKDHNYYVLTVNPQLV
ncbi:MAG: hypothetical protein JWQ57_1615 [Mucilaginibacter sp.]|jgi:uncharacterized RDD family membrane protein YckC|nr:hypothetical protein [Mucilaginibacter sp.]